MMTVRAGVIGLGVGRQHALGLAAHPDCVLVAIADRDPARLAEIGAEFPHARRHISAAALLDDPDLDLVVVASNDDDHAAQILAALDRGLHVFSEKPLTTREEDTWAIAQALAARPDLHLSTNTVLRRSPRFMSLKADVEAGRLGRLTAIEGDYNYGRLWKLTEGWRGRIPDYSVMLGGGVHLADLMLWLNPSPLREVFALGNGIATRDTAFQGRDLALALVAFENGVVGKLGANFACVEPHFHRLLVYGTEATFENGRDCALLWRSREPDAVPERIDTPYPAVPKHALLPSFIDAILGRGKADVEPLEVFAAMAVCHAVDRSLASGKPERVVLP